MGFYSMVAFFQKGGLFMYPILLVFAVGMAIAFERWVQLNRIRNTNQKVWKQLHPVLVKGEFDKARKMINNNKSNMAQMLGMGLARQGAVRRRDDIEIAMEESMMEIIPQLEKRTPYVALLSNIATLLGLLGTIMGLIEAFTAVANANPAEKADLLSASISVAMNTTAFGLMSAIPLLLLHAKLTSTTGQIVDSLEMASVKTLNTISNFAKRQFDEELIMIRRLHSKRKREETPELDITTFLNLMVVLIPFLLISAVFSRVTIMELSVPTSAGGSALNTPNFAIEVIVRKKGLEIANGSSVEAAIPKKDDQYDMQMLYELLKRLKARYPEKDDATVLMEPDIEYDHLIQIMDAVRGAEVQMEGSEEVKKMVLFPNISIGDAP